MMEFLRQKLDNLAAETAASMTIAHPIMHNWQRERFQICIPIQQNHFRKQ
jgi:hypothetical protein